MRIPPSVIVMSLVTAVPFALAVHDTMKPHPKTYDEMSDEEREAQFEEEMRKESAEQAQRDAAETAKRAATYKTFFGEKPAQLGSYFNSVHLDMVSSEREFDELAGTTTVDAINFEGDKRLETIRISESEHCDELRAQMIAAWQDAPDGIYLDAASHQRASFQECTLTFSRYVDVNQWIDTKGDVPVALSWIGMPADKLREQLGEHLTNDDGEVLMWNAPGIGRGNDPTHITARIENDKIAGLAINVMTDAPTVDAVHARLDGLLGKGAPDAEDPDLLTWKGKGKVHASMLFSAETLSIELLK